mgnify:FL=1
MNHSLSNDVERLIDDVFDKIVPHNQYRVVRADEAVPCARSIVHVQELYDGYISPFSSEEYDYKMQAIVICSSCSAFPFSDIITRIVEVGMAYKLATMNLTDFLWAYTDGAARYETDKGPLLHMRAFVASYMELGLSAFDYEY